MKMPILLRGSFAGSFFALLVFAGGMPTGLAQDLETLRKDRIAVLEDAVVLLTDIYSMGLGGNDPIVRLRIGREPHSGHHLAGTHSPTPTNRTPNSQNQTPTS